MTSPAAPGESSGRRLPKLPSFRPSVQDRPSGVDGPATSKAGNEEPFDPSSWTGALVVMGVFAAVLYVLETFDAIGGHHLDQHGLKPRSLSGLFGIVTAPFLHDSWWHLISNTGPFVLLGWAVLLSGVRSWLIVTGLVMLLGGLATWLIAPSGVIVGASGVIFGWMGYLLARAWFSRKILYILGALVVGFFFTGLFAGLLPSANANVSWQGHVCGFAGGVATGWLLHPRKARGTKSAPVS